MIVSTSHRVCTMKNIDFTDFFNVFLSGATIGWNVISIPGNDMRAVDAALTAAEETKGKPTMIIANTVKGSGISFMENQVAWHHKVFSKEQYEQAVGELQEKWNNICAEEEHGKAECHENSK